MEDTWQLFRRVLSEEMKPKGAVAAYDAVKNILFIDDGKFQQLTDNQRQQALTCKDVIYF